MASILKTKNPITPGQRFHVSLVKDYSEDDLKKVKKLRVKQKRSSGIDNQGHQTSRFRGGGHKKAYRIINFQWLEKDFGSSFEIVRFEYDPNRNVPICLIKCISGNRVGEYLYIIRPENSKVGDILTVTVDFVEMISGSVCVIKNIPVGTMVHCVELKPFKGGQIARSAGAYVQIMGRDSGYVILKMPSGETRKVLDTCLATIGQVANKQFLNTVIGKAGRNRWLGRRPHVRGVAMNPVDHPLGGGEGKTSGGRHPVSPWGQNCKGLKTRKNKRTNVYIVSRKKSKV